ncbi:MAG TPA: dihydroorotate dehydrogenase [Candidatus Mcinerneyibacteriales bacterium]|nr:dihydroorotate dehydrogenase [Candidatus Mcinerneyibacteriales bacterium]HPE20208.1 dihydroorotate dehydrogenase [Candidatus Mcinerneyibacteriales bacterium]HPJ70107.1 dihydroorotate dehydrogenase [Candidatus Mcinerneyibacteriales bacterium]HPQ90230.1 dihydroorotate dehydrogenase [Candidatus Mcinerneyibacteriales bacterium]
MAEMTLKIGGQAFKNPVFTASGTFGYGDEYEEIFDPALLGAVCSKGLTRFPREGNAPPRLMETPAGLLNSVGLQNMGIEPFIREKVPQLVEKGISIIANIAGHSTEEFAEMAYLCNESPGILAVELNVSCPNVKEGGMAFGIRHQSVSEITSACRKALQKPLIVKLSPNVTDITEMAEAALESGADALTVANTLLGMAIDVEKRAPAIHNVFAGLSGPAVKPVALRMVYQVKKAFPHAVILASGGIVSTRDALEFFMAGASGVQIGTGLFRTPDLPLRIIRGLEEFCDENGMRTVSGLTGLAIKEMS